MVSEGLAEYPEFVTLLLCAAGEFSAMISLAWPSLASHFTWNIKHTRFPFTFYSAVLEAPADVTRGAFARDWFLYKPVIESSRFTKFTKSRHI